MTTATSTMENKQNKPEDQEEAPIPQMTQAEFADKMETHQAFIHTKSGELTKLMDTLKAIRENKEPLAQVKNTLQEEINNCNKAINAVSEEVTHLKQKLRYHNVKQIYDNIERLEYQLRNNNYKPREEQKILDEISMLQRSTRTLKEYEAKQSENKKYRGERTRLIEERNSLYSKIRALYANEDETKKEIAALRGEISAKRKSIDHLRQLRPKLEQEWQVQQNKMQAVRNKRFEEKRRLRQEQIRERQEERRKLWEEYEASREPYEEEKNLCRLLITYLQSRVSGSTPNTPASVCSSTSGFTPATTPSQPAPAFPSSSSAEATNSPCRSRDMDPPESSGAYYCKPKDEDGFIKVNKRSKAKARKEQKLASRTKELPHTPDVLKNFSKLSITPPKNTDQIPAVVVSLQDKLQHFHSLACSNTSAIQGDDTVENTDKSNPTGKCSRPKSLPVVSSSLPIPAVTAATTPTERNSTIEIKVNGQVSPVTSSSSTRLYTVTSPASVPVINVLAPSWKDNAVPNHIPNGNLSESHTSIPANTENVYSGMNGVQENVTSLPELHMCSDILSVSNCDSYFSGPMSYTCNGIDGKIIQEPNNNNEGFSYAAIASKVKPLSF